MKNFTSTYLDSIYKQVTTLCTCIRVKPKTGSTEYTYTTFDRKITVDGIVYKPTNGFIPTGIVTDNSLAVNNLDITGLIDGIDLTEEDIRRNLFLDAEVWIFEVDYNNPTGGIDKQLYGNIGTVTLRQNIYIAEFRSISQRLAQNILSLYSRTCRVEFGSSECGITNYLTENGQVTGIRYNYNFYTNLTLNGNFTHGVLTWTSGNNLNNSFDVKGHSTGAILLYLSPNFKVEIGDTFTIREGCNHLFTGDCQYTWNNTINFRGEPYMPSSDRITGDYGTVRD